MSNKIELPPERELDPQLLREMRVELVDELTSPSPKRRRLPRLPRFTLARTAGVVAFAAVLVIAVIAFGPSRGDSTKGNPLLERAYASLSRSDVIWRVRMAMISEAGSSVDRATTWTNGTERSHSIFTQRSTSPDTIDSDQEIMRDGDLFRWYERSEGQEAIYETTSKRRQPNFFLFGADQNGSFDPRAFTKALLADDQLKQIDQRSIEYRGKPAKQITYDYPPKQGGPGRIEVVIDPESGFILRYALYVDRSSPSFEPSLPPGDPAFEMRFDRYKSFPLNDRTERLLRMRPHPGVLVCRYSKASPPMLAITGDRCPPENG